MTRFCFVCGKRTDELSAGRCADCYNRAFDLVRVPERLELLMCSKCALVKIANRWLVFDPERYLHRKMRISGSIERLRIEKTNKAYKIFAKGVLQGGLKPKKEVHTVTVHMSKITCPVCTRFLSGYYEAILQLRGALRAEILDFIGAQMATIKSTDRKAFYTARQLKEGIDLYVSSKSAASKIAVMLRKRFAAQLKKSYKLVTRKAGKNVYRTIIAVRFK
jgi:nonsense-mediated mRNA decay protein 3